MSSLIIGGLLVVALLAIAGSIFAARGGDTSSEKSTTAPQVDSSETRAETSPQPEEASELPLPPPIVAPADDGQAHTEQIEATAPLTDGLPLYHPNGQVHELTTQLQTLHEEAQRLSQRLNILTEMAEHIEQSTHAGDGV